ncbi:MAG: SMI1/KNR4 family protein [Verrucomicrobia bacterium]|nr:SMI1/KNR4 family protein [Verrucomicrobiota bacterium]
MPSFRGIQIELTTQPDPISDAEIRSAEAALGCTFPPDYRDFLLQFGIGEFAQIPLRVLPPSALIWRTPEDQERLREYWFWADSSEVWSQNLACESIACFDGSCGDDVRFHPSNSSSFYVLPHEDSQIFRIATFAELIACFFTIYGVTPQELSFEPQQAHVA